MHFHDRTDAGRQLAVRLAERNLEAPVVLALPRGGVPVGYEIAQALQAPLDVLIARKLGAPRQRELAIGAIAEGSGFYLNSELSERLHVSESYLEDVVRTERAEIERRRTLYRGSRPPIQVRGRMAIIVDDGLATGATTIAAVRSLREQEPRVMVLAVPVCAPDTLALVRREIGDVICLISPSKFRAVGGWYDAFDQTSDREVVELLHRAERSMHAKQTRTEALT